MKKLLLLLTLTVFLVGCKGRKTPQPSQEVDVSLEKLTCEEQSILEKMDNTLTCNFGSVKKFSVALMVKPKNENDVSVNVETFGHSVAQGSIPNYTAYLTNGANIIKIVCTAKNDPNVQKTYTIKITKSSASVPNNESSKLKELKFDGKDLLGSMTNKNTCELADVVEDKNEAILSVVPENASATVNVSNGNESIESTGTNTYKVALAKGLNEIYVKVASMQEGEKLHIIRVYRTEDLTLKSFNVEGVEYCKNGEISTKYLRFASSIQSVRVAVQANAEMTSIVFKHNGIAIQESEGAYVVNLANGNNGIEVIVQGRGAVRSNTYTVTFVRLSANTPNSGLVRFVADGNDLLSKFSSKNVLVLPSCNHDKASVKLEVLATPEYTIKVMCNTQEVQSSEGSYTLSLQDGLNTVAVSLAKDGTQDVTYIIYITRHPAPSSIPSPESGEVRVSFVVSDGVNSSAVDGSYLNISKTNSPSSSTNKKVLIREGKAEVNLKKDDYYDFKIEGQNAEHSPILYAASNVISYYIADKPCTVSIVQRPLSRITKEAVAPEITALKFGSDALQAGQAKDITSMEDISISVKTASYVDKLDWATPYPMLGVGFVPTKADEGQAGSGIFYATNTAKNAKQSDGKWTSTWMWQTASVQLKEHDYVDVVLVLYDVASNRVERHIRLKMTSATAAQEVNDISIDHFKLYFDRYPTQSQLYSIGRDGGTGAGGYYNSELQFCVNKAGSPVTCTAFDLYRKCVEDGGDFALVKHVLLKTPTASENPLPHSPSRPHVIYDSDSLLQDEKTYQYKVIAYTENNEKNALSSSSFVSFKVPKSTSLLLEYPVNTSLTLSQTQNMQFAFRFSNPDALKNASEVEMGLIITERTGEAIYGSKFKYVFEDVNGKPELYFAESKGEEGFAGYIRKVSSLTNKALEELIIVDVEKGTVKITKDFFLLTKVNLINAKVVSYKKGTTYCWDVHNWGEPGSSLFDGACKITMKTSDNVLVTVPVNDNRNGKNAWNGRAEFSIKWD